MSMLLAIDTAHDACAVGIRMPQGSTLVKRQPMKRGQSEALMPMVDQVFKEAGVSPADVSAFCVNNGPGRFTGIRLGLAAAKGLALPHGTIVIGINSTEILATKVISNENITENTSIVTGLSSGRGNVFLQLWDASGQARSPVLDLSPDKALKTIEKEKDIYFIGDGYGVMKDKMKNISILGYDDMQEGNSISALLSLGYDKITHGNFNPVARPFYCRKPDVTIDT